MPRRIQLAPHLSVEELGQRFKQAPTPGAARRYQALWLIAQGQTAKAAAARVGLSDKWVRALVHRYNAVGAAGRIDHRTQHPGRAPRLPADQPPTVAQALQTPPAAGGVWTGRTVAAGIERRTGRPTPHQRGGDDLRRRGDTPQRPPPRHPAAAAAAAQAAWQQTSRNVSSTCRPRPRPRSRGGVRLTRAVGASRSVATAGLRAGSDHRRRARCATRGGMSRAWCGRPRARPTGGACRPCIPWR